ncbi:MAG: SDR family NAD(P)-dependent oxidoreductase [Alphaproteobacteria bacterium]|nr:SDR family NAD(P)-dependent oxidoreductase [Alphaproteobacteria bacterium]
MSSLITSPFGYRTTAREAAAGHDLSGRRMIVTGAASGIGVETARALALQGAEVTIAARDLGKAKEVADAINAEAGAPRVTVGKLDLADLGSVRSFASSWSGPLHALINNAGVMASPLMHTAQNFEMQIGANHLGHFTLTTGLAGALEAGAKGGKPARVVSLSSIGHRRSDIRWEDPHFRNGDYEKWTSYGQSKTANSLFAVGVTNKWKDRGILANAVMPGGIITPLQRHLSKEEQIGFGWIDENGVPNERMKTPEQGASTSVWAAVGGELEGVGGKYLENCAEAGPWKAEEPWSGVLPYAVDPVGAERLWAWSENEVAGA